MTRLLLTLPHQNKPQGTNHPTVDILTYVARKRDSWREERKGVGERDGRVDETKTAVAAAATAEVVDGGGVCRDKYLPVNTERLALPSRSISMRAANDMHSRGRNVCREGQEDGNQTNHKRARLRDKVERGEVVARHRYPVQQPHGASTVPFRLCLANIHSCSR
ncbi:hypothetical protein ALC60_00324 [Trachymyrmex zeteki]|uniref:Uncharacterized protein n=1 Tax=Mycetomoellerius zeteki TaxID=64791 RepID=A0A151XJY5_9HYME|nr:hypothetical protein ALC60_00324 [Trachymyrmex zeteki]